MPVWTSYLGFFRRIADEYEDALVKIAERLKETDPKAHGLIVYFVMRGRGNDAVAPSKSLLAKYKYVFVLLKPNIWFPQYKKEYLEQINGSEDARYWMCERADEAKRLHVVFVCFEKDSWRCHRRLLAEYMAENFGVDYRAELSTLF